MEMLEALRLVYRFFAGLDKAEDKLKVIENVR